MHSILFSCVCCVWNNSSKLAINSVNLTSLPCRIVSKWSSDCWSKRLSGKDALLVLELLLLFNGSVKRITYCHQQCRINREHMAGVHFKFVLHELNGKCFHLWKRVAVQLNFVTGEIDVFSSEQSDITTVVSRAYKEFENVKRRLKTGKPTTTKNFPVKRLLTYTLLKAIFSLLRQIHPMQNDPGLLSFFRQSIASVTQTPDIK